MAERQCEREGCDQSASTYKPGRRFCSFACRAVETELMHAQRLCSAIGPRGAAVGDLWATAVAMNDSLSEYRRRERQLFSFAESVGITPDQWYGFKRHPERETSTVTTQSTPTPDELQQVRDERARQLVEQRKARRAEKVRRGRR
jgi:hypothetical protein